MKGGEGGDDSKLFALDLFSAYMKYARAHKLKSEPLSAGGGHYVAKITGHRAWSVFKDEAGKHCVQRIPPTERGGRRQTSYLTVGVLPVFAHSASVVPDSEIEVKTQRGHGKGGQHQNKTDSAVRMRHKPTGLQVFINGRSQTDNKREARRILVAKIMDQEWAEKNAEYSAIRHVQMSDSGRGSKIRTYNFINSRAADHRTGKKSSQVQKIIARGEFDRLK